MISIKPSCGNFPKLKNEKMVTNGVNSILIGTDMPGTYLNEIHNMELKETDILLSTFARSGTTITRLLLVALMYGPEDILNNPEFNMDHLSPFIEFEPAHSTYDENAYSGYNAMMSMQDAPKRLLKTHLPIWLAPKSAKAKKVIITRDVKDTLVSYYHMYRNDKGHPPDIYNTLDFDTFYKMFLSGNTYCGDWFQWHRGWLDALDNNTLLIHYEDLIESFEETVTKLAKFVDVEITPALMDSLKEVANFKRMKQALDNPNIKDFVRKGIVGDYKNHMNDDQVKFLNDKCKEIVPELSI